MKVIGAILILVVLSSCAGVVKKETFNKEVTDLKALSTVGKVTLSWILSDDSDVEKIEIWSRYNRDGQASGFTKMKGNIERTARSIELSVEPLSDVDFKVILVSKDKAVSRGVSVKTFVPHKNVVVDQFEGRKLYIYLPEGYEKVKKPLPVVYFHDGQNLFSRNTGSSAEWHVDEVLDKLIAEGKVEKMVVVGIPNGGSKRADEYIPYRGEFRGIKVTGESSNFVKWIVNGVIPYVEKNYRVSKERLDRAVMGSSLGGLVSLWMVIHYSEVFSMAGVVSPHSPWIIEDLKKWDKKDIRIWMDTGTAEFGFGGYNYTDGCRQMIGILTDKGYEYGKDLIYYEVYRALHNETEWAKRVAYPFIMFKGKQDYRISDFEPIAQRMQYPFRGIKRIINAVAVFDNGLQYSLYGLPKYKVLKGKGVKINAIGELSFGDDSVAEIEVSYAGIKKTVIITN